VCEESERSLNYKTMAHGGKDTVNLLFMVSRPYCCAFLKSERSVCPIQKNGRGFTAALHFPQKENESQVERFASARRWRRWNGRKLPTEAKTNDCNVAKA